ncbi:hypothetical protein SCP_0116740 [Sparassis crispa]|uniref:Uncharacterized protein n=1 Tax=Sparassis crispa TaxID=139825 RepID=A0A401G9D9_9APHY|nr:hypothetical protein SCP_0116740 [Sparassis crispa]GBE78781.1 hypothetical protein SCP_0116740 [Sparassis crispa]
MGQASDLWAHGRAAAWGGAAMTRTTREIRRTGSGQTQGITGRSYAYIEIKMRTLVSTVDLIAGCADVDDQPSTHRVRRSPGLPSKPGDAKRTPSELRVVYAGFSQESVPHGRRS